MATSTNETTANYHGITGEAGMSINVMLGSLAILDRAKAIEIIKCLAVNNGDLQHEHYPQMNIEKLIKLMIKIENYKHYCLNLYPHGAPSINLLAFNGEEAIKKIEEIRHAYGAHVWYIE